MNSNNIARETTKILRHTAMVLNLNINDEGYVKLDDLINYFSKKYPPDSLSFELFNSIVESDQKNRFNLIQINNDWYIRANQGHTMGLNPELLLTKVVNHSEIPYCIHGTYKDKLPLIIENGLSKMNRDQIHMTTNRYEPSLKHVPCIRHSINTIIQINVELAMNNGIEFYISDNGVILSPGNEEGVIPSKYFIGISYI
jgi:2'-phosphotransferase